MNIKNPYVEVPGGVWMRGNLHTHTTASDGHASPQATIDAYSALRYDFLALSDHDVAPNYDGLDPRGLVLIPASEVSAAGKHVLAVGCRERVEPDPDRQKVIDTLNDKGALAILCHPNWGRDFGHYSIEELFALSNYTGVEVFNGSIVEDPGNPIASDKWDRLLSAGKRVWALATDDIHFPQQRGRGYCCVHAAERSADAVMAALRSGNFYASTGVRISNIEIRGTELRLTSPDAEGIAVVGQFGRRQAWVESHEISWNAAGSETPYFRVECFGRAGAMAWTQPFHIEP